MNNILLKIITFFSLVSSMTSCSDDIDLSCDNKSDKIVFNLCNSNEWIDTRSSQFNHRHTNIPELDVLESSENSYSKNIYLHIISEDINIESFDSPASRANRVNQLYSEMGVTGLVFEGDINDASPNFMEDERININGNKIFTDRYWPEENKSIKFFARSPYQLEGQYKNYMSFTYPILTYELPENPIDQKDILLGESKTVKGKPESGIIDLNFYHPLTSITFSATAFEEGEITSIGLCNVVIKGEYNQLTKDKWKALKRGNINLSLTDCKTSSAATDTININEDETTFIMIPQDFDNNMEQAYVLIKFKDKLTNTNHELSFALSGKWHSGKSYKYFISTNPDFIVNCFECDSEPIITCNYLGEIQDSNSLNKDDFNLTSYEFLIKSYAAIKCIGKPTEYIEIPFPKDKESLGLPDWITLSFEPLEGNPFIKGCYKFHLSISKQNSFVDNSTHDENIRNMPFKDYVYNLSNSNGFEDIQNTANCYIINGPGKYKLPLIYGNSIKDGKDNYMSYKNSELNPSFVDYCGLPITKPQITLPPNCSVCVIWSDVKDMVQNLHYSEDYLYFDIFSKNTDRSDIREGNAVIGIKDNSGNIVWSWHLWLTDYILGNDLSIDGTTFMPLNLGYCYGSNRTYHPDEYVLNINQDNTGESISIKVNRLQFIDDVDNNCTYYQWGRKDPIPGSGGYHEDKTIFYGTLQKANAPVPISTSIKNPLTFYRSVRGTQWYSGQVIYNLWDANAINDNSSNTSIVKTIYDPCPPGYMIPNSFYLSKIIDSLNWDESINAYTYKQGDITAIFPIRGYRASNTASVDSDNQGYCATSSTNSTNIYQLFYSKSSSPIMTRTNGRTQIEGIPVHPIREISLQ